MPSLPLELGGLRVPARWLRIVNADEASAAAADGAGLVASFAHNRRLLAFRFDTYTSLEATLADDAEFYESLAAAEIVADDEQCEDGAGFATASDLAHLFVVVNHREHLPKWPEHKWWGGVAGIEDELSPCDSHSANCKCNLPPKQACQGPPLCALEHEHRLQKRCCGAACQTLRLASCEVRLEPTREEETDGGGGGGGRLCGSLYSASIRVFLEAVSFDLEYAYLLHSNLGGKGPDFDAPASIRFVNVMSLSGPNRQTVYIDLVLLTNPVSSCHSLEVVLGVPVAVKDDDSVRCGKVNTKTSGQYKTTLRC